MQQLSKAILDWTASRPSWQQDAMRRIFTSGTLKPDDINDFLAICETEQGLRQAAPLVPVPLASEHLPKAAASAVVTLLRLADVRGVNAIAAGSNLGFSKTGLTVVYGDNGAGKSGYARLLKHLCRARGESRPILPNIFFAGPATPISATVEYEVDAALHSFPWKAGEKHPVELGQVSIFDSMTASIYVEEKMDVAFVPFGLDAFPKLVNACDSLRTRIEGKITALGPGNSFIELQGDTLVGRVIANLDHDGAAAAVGSLVDLVATEAERLRVVSDLVRELDAKAPRSAAATRRLKATRFRGLLQACERVSAACAPSRVDSVKAAVDLEAQASAAAELADSGVTGKSRWQIHGGPWFSLWSAARDFSTRVAYPGKTYPVTDDDSICVLCQQDLGADAKERLRSFEDFVQGETQRRSQSAKSALDAHLAALARDQFDPKHFAAGIAEVALEHEGVAKALSAFFQSCSARLASVLNATRDASWAEIPELTALDQAPLAAICVNLDLEAAELERASEPEEDRKLRAEHRELVARRSLAGVRGAVVLEIERRKKVRKLEACKRQTDTTHITAKNTELTKAGVSEALKLTFESELKSLQLEQCVVVLEPLHGEKGITYHQVRFDSAKTVAYGTRDVLSEGEHRCVALAAFLAELSTQPSPSTAVFDDPVSSLDHVRRELVAGRLVQEAVKRPVVIFTHDLVFLLCLQEHCETTKIPFNASFVSKQGNCRGVVTDGLPWYGMPLKKRIGYLRDQAVKLQTLEKQGPSETFEIRTAYLWGRLREAWECGVEETLLNDSVKRFSRKIQTQRLRKVHDLQPTDVDAVEKGMTECSKWLPGHDIAAEVNATMPKAAAFAAAVEDLEGWRSSIEVRRK